MKTNMSHAHTHGHEGHSELWYRRRAAVERRQETRRTKYLLLGAICMIPGLMLYFGGGYLFVSAYNERFPFAEIPVDPFLVRIFWYIGPIFFFIGLTVFVIAYASFCKGIDNQEY